MVENPDYEPMDRAHRDARRASVDRMAAVEAAKRHRQPRDLTRLIVLLAVIVGLVTVTSTSIAVYSLVRLDAQQTQLADQQARTTANRRATSDVICDKLNDAVRAAQRNVDTLNGLIIASVKASRAFEDTYTRLGLPGYEQRLKDARRQTGDLARTKPHGIDCGQLAESITAAAR